MRRCGRLITFTTLAFCFVLSALSPSWADTDLDGFLDGLLFSGRIAGTYLLFQEPPEDPDFLFKLKRIVTITEDGSFFSVSQEQFFGFTDGQGPWKRSGIREITARIIDFDFNVTEGDDKPFGTPTGVTRVVFTITFTQLVDGKFQEVNGTFSGETFAPGEDPLHPSPDSIKASFKGAFTGQRVTVD
jgi:hypothetical protein